jgi:hypothetical protein
MKRTAIVVAITLLGAHQAEACHRYRYWHFRMPQRCGTHISMLMPKARPPQVIPIVAPPKTLPPSHNDEKPTPQKVKPIPYDVPTQMLEPLIAPSDDLLRAKAIEQLKEKMKGTE